MFFDHSFSYMYIICKDMTDITLCNLKALTPRMHQRVVVHLLFLQQKMAPQRACHIYLQLNIGKWMSTDI